MDGAGGMPCGVLPAGSKAELEAQAGVELAAAEAHCARRGHLGAYRQPAWLGVGSCGRKVRWGEVSAGWGGAKGSWRGPAQPLAAGGPGQRVGWSSAIASDKQGGEQREETKAETSGTCFPS